MKPGNLENFHLTAWLLCEVWGPVSFVYKSIWEVVHEVTTITMCDTLYETQNSLIFYLANNTCYNYSSEYLRSFMSYMWEMLPSASHESTLVQNPWHTCQKYENEYVYPVYSNNIIKT